MKILFYNHTGQVSGAERMLLMTLSGMSQQAFTVSLICPEQGPLQKMAANLGVPVQPLANLNAKFTLRPGHLARYCKSFFGTIRQLRRAVVRLQPDLLHANSIRAGLVATAATIGLRVGVVWHLHDMLPRHPLSTVVRIVAGLSLRTHMISVSAAVAKNFRGRLSRLMEDRVAVILNAIEIDKFQPEPGVKGRLRKELRFREADFVLGIVGQLTPRKGQLELLRAFAKALAEVPNMVLLVAGAPLFNQDHEYLAQLKRTAADLRIENKVRLLGARSEIAALMQTLDLLVVNSSTEPFGLVIPEAMACDAPVLAAAVDGIPEIIQHRENGWLFPVGDEAALTQAIVQLARQPELRERLANRARQHVAAHFSAGRYFAELEAFYRFKSNRAMPALSVESTGGPAEAAKFA